MINVKSQNGTFVVDFKTTMFFEEMLKCPSNKRKEFIEHIEKKDAEWLFRFCIENFGDKIFHFESEVK
jgi:hypothetical protein